MNLGIKVSQIEGGDFLAQVDWSKGDAGQVGTPGACHYGHTEADAYRGLKARLERKGHTIIAPETEPHSQPTATAELPTRHISGVSEEEAKTIFALAFGYGPVPSQLIATRSKTDEGASVNMLEVGNGLHHLQLYGNGYAIAYRHTPNSSDLMHCGFNLAKVTGFLSAINVVIGGEESAFLQPQQ